MKNIRIIPKLDIKGAIFSEQDEVGDSFIFCQNLSKWLQDNKTRFIFNRRVEKLAIWKDRVTGYFSEGKFYEADQIVSCLGSFTNKIVDHPIPVLPVKGYSITLNPGKKQLFKNQKFNSKLMTSYTNNHLIQIIYNLYYRGN